MDYWPELQARLRGLDRWQCAPVACGAAESVRPIIEAFGEDATRRAFQDGLAVAWTQARSAAPDPRARRARAAIDELPESHFDDSHFSSYHAMSALGVLAYALESVLGCEPLRGTADACRAATGIYGGYNHTLTHGGGAAIVDSRNLPTPGRLKTMQMDAQFRWIGEVASVKSARAEVVDGIRASARELAGELDRLIPSCAAEHGWPIGGEAVGWKALLEASGEVVRPAGAEGAAGAGLAPGPAAMPGRFSDWPHTWFGWWDELTGADRFCPSIREFVAPSWNPPERERILSYLVSCPIVGSGSRTLYPCIFGGMECIRRWRETLLVCERTDGEWSWYDDLAHYIIHHNLRPPDAFVRHMVVRRFAVPSRNTLDMKRLEQELETPASRE